jgi:hypothetical protein
MVLVAVLLVTGGCSYYSFSGATIPSHISTVAIPLVQDNSVNPVNTLDRQLTDLLTDRFVGRTSLSLSNNESNADARLTAVIVGYRNRPTAVTGDEVASQNEVSIRVRVEYYDQEKDEEMLTRTFTNSAQYDPVEQGAAGEEQAARVALERLADEIFTAATSNW